MRIVVFMFKVFSCKDLFPCHQKYRKGVSRRSLALAQQQALKFSRMIFSYKVVN